MNTWTMSLCWGITPTSSSVVSITSRETEKALRFRQAVLLDDVIMMATHHVIRRSFTTHRAPRAGADNINGDIWRTCTPDYITSVEFNREWWKIIQINILAFRRRGAVCLLWPFSQAVKLCFFNITKIDFFICYRGTTLLIRTPFAQQFICQAFTRIKVRIQNRSQCHPI